MSKKEEIMEKGTIPAEMFACLDEKGENYIVQIELPGVEKRNIELSMHDDLVSVKAERKDIMFLGHLHFPLKVNPKKAEATFKQGLLAVQVPVKEKRSPPTLIKIK
jgi:HSP20 family protein